MKVVDLHPEELLDKDARGELTAAERARLDTHLARCATCRFERQARADFADELRADDAPLAALNLAALDLGKPAPRPRSVRPRRAPSVWLFAAAALFIGGIAGATARGWSNIGFASLESSSVNEVREVAPAPPVTTHAVNANPSPTAPPLSVEGPQPSPVPVAVVPVPAVTPTPSPLSVVAPTLTSPSFMTNNVAPRRSVPEGPVSLFAEATDARRRGEHLRAIELNRSLEDRYPGSREAHVSYATLGQLLLDRGDASAALASFDAYRARGSGELDEAVMIGRATAFERLGRVDDARAAWSALLATFPHTPYARHAQRRIDDSGSR